MPTHLNAHLQFIFITRGFIPYLQFMYETKISSNYMCNMEDLFH